MENNELFNGLDGKLNFLNGKKQGSKGLYKIDLKKVDKKKGYRSLIRFLPNFKKDGTVGQSAIEKITHYIDLPDYPSLKGYYDSPANFKEKELDTLANLYWEMKKSSNAILWENSKKIQYFLKYYSYVLILEDENCPELVGKIMILQYGKTIKDKIAAEKNGDVTGVKCNIFSLTNGKDFVLLVKQTGIEKKYPDYKSSAFKPQSSPIQIFKDNSFKTVPLNNDGEIDEKARPIVKEFLLSREHDLGEFEPKKLDADQLNKIQEIRNILTNKTNNPTASDFVEEKTTTIAEDDFFAN